MTHAPGEIIEVGDETMSVRLFGPEALIVQVRKAPNARDGQVGILDPDGSFSRYASKGDIAEAVQRAQYRNTMVFPLVDRVACARFANVIFSELRRIHLRNGYERHPPRVVLSFDPQSRLGFSWLNLLFDGSDAPLRVPIE